MDYGIKLKKIGLLMADLPINVVTTVKSFSPSRLIPLPLPMAQPRGHEKGDGGLL